MYFRLYGIFSFSFNWYRNAEWKFSLLNQNNFNHFKRTFYNLLVVPKSVMEILLTRFDAFQIHSNWCSWENTQMPKCKFIQYCLFCWEKLEATFELFLILWDIVLMNMASNNPTTIIWFWLAKPKCQLISLVNLQKLQNCFKKIISTSIDQEAIMTVYFI